jgi:hypothetical protein
MSSRYRLHSKSAFGRSGAQSDELVTELASALSLEEVKLRGSADNESFSMVSEGEGGCCTPLGVVSGESSLPTSSSACSSLSRPGYFGWGGGNLDHGSSASPSLGRRGDSSSPAPMAGSRQARTSLTLFRPVRLERRSSAAHQSAAAQDQGGYEVQGRSRRYEQHSPKTQAYKHPVEPRAHEQS